MPRPPWSRLAQLASLLEIFPEVLVCDLESGGKAECEQAGHLDSGWGINGKTLRSLLMRNPKVFGYKID